MNVVVSAQAISTVLSFALGSLIGILYDLLRILRRTLHIPAVITDILFWFAAALCSFTLGMTFGEGQIRLFMLALIALGASIYFYSLSAIVLRFFSSAINLICFIASCAVKPFLYALLILKKIEKNLKNIFHYSAKWYNIKYTDSSAVRKQYRNKTASEGEKAYEVTSGKYIYETRNPNTHRLRGHNADKSKRAYKQSRYRTKRASSSKG